MWVLKIRFLFPRLFHNMCLRCCSDFFQMLIKDLPSLPAFPLPWATSVRREWWYWSLGRRAFERTISGGIDQGLGSYDGTANEYTMWKWSDIDTVVSEKGVDWWTCRLEVLMLRLWLRNRFQKFPAWHTKAAPNGKCCEGYIVPSMVRLMYQLKSVLK